MVVACVAGFGTWGQGFTQSVANAPTYASELFGGATKLTYPSGVPVVHLTLKNHPQVRNADDTADVDFAIDAASKSKVTFSFANGTFTGVVPATALVCETTADSAATPIVWSSDNCTVTLTEGGAKDGSTVTYELTIGATAVTVSPQGGTEAAPVDGASQMRLVLTVPALTATNKVTVASSLAPSVGDIPSIVNDCPTDKEAKAMCNRVVNTMDATTATVTGGGDAPYIHPDDFKMLQPMADGKPRTTVTLGSYKLMVSNNDGNILDASGNAITASMLEASMQVMVSGDVNEGDQIMVEGDDNKTMTVAAGAMSVSGPVSGVTGSKGVTLKYKPAGKMDLSHGAEIKASFMPAFSNASRMSIKAESRTTMLKIHGIEGEDVMAYGLPGTMNGKNDVSNVRVRCEDGSGTMNDCRIFLECWDSDGMGDIGEIGKLAENALMVLDAEDIEMYSGVEAGMRHSCRVLSSGTVAVQSLVRDGTTGTLVNNTAVSTNQ